MRRLRGEGLPAGEWIGRTTLRAIAVGMALAGGPVVAAWGQTSKPPVLSEATAPPPAAVPTPVAVATGSQPASTSVVINLIRLLVQEGVLTQAKADALIRQAEDEAAAAARGQAGTVAATAAPVPAAGSSPAVASTSVRVPYVPEIVKKQIRDEVKQEVLAQAKAENWAAPNALPEWTKRFHPYGDIRLRYEWDLFAKRNSPFPDFATLNSGNPFDFSGYTNPGVEVPQLDTTVNRERMRLRARVGTTIDIADDFTADLELATGNTTNPVSTNQTLGTDLNKDNILLNRATLKYTPTSWATAWFGRFDNPWLSSELVWSNEINFDGVAVKLAPHIDDETTPFLTFGAFPIENTTFSFPEFTGNKQNSDDKWLYGAQAGADWHPSHDYDAKFGVAYYDFSNIEGKTSSLCDPGGQAAIPCSTDDSRPGILQQGNTLFFIRHINPTSVVPTTTNVTDFQYFGLASSFRELNVTGTFDAANFDPIHLMLTGDFVDNLAFDRHSIITKGPVNNNGATAVPATVGPYAGGNIGFLARAKVGMPSITNRWDWSLSLDYRYIESDAVVDAFNDSDFHLGGTNAKGYSVIGNLGIAHNVYLSGRWFSTSEVSGPPYSVDVVQVDINAKF